MSKVFAIGDIHGCAYELKQLLKILPFDKDSTIVFLGDYVDRGPGSQEVIQTIIELKKHTQVVTLTGNHEDMFLEFLRDPSSILAGLFILNGGSATLASYVIDGSNYIIPDEHLQFLNDLQLYHETDTHFFVHAGVPEIHLNQLDDIKNKNDLIWIRNKFLRSNFNWEKMIVHGHTPTKQVELKENRINLDTGCVFQGQLSAIEVHSGEIFSVPARKQIPLTFLKSDPSMSRVAARFSGSIPVHIPINGIIHEYETLNYNEFGLLILERSDSSTERILQVGQILTGTIGAIHTQQFEFTGEVVRHQKRNNQIAYGVKMLKPLKAKTDF